MHKHILQACVPRGQVDQLRALALHGRQQCGDGLVRLAHVQQQQAVIHVHRIHTDLAHAWLHGYRRPPYWNTWWHYVDIDAEQRMRATR